MCFHGFSWKTKTKTVKLKQQFWFFWEKPWKHTRVEIWTGLRNWFSFEFSLVCFGPYRSNSDSLKGPILTQLWRLTLELIHAVQGLKTHLMCANLHCKDSSPTHLFTNTQRPPWPNQDSRGPPCIRRQRSDISLVSNNLWADLKILSQPCASRSPLIIQSTTVRSTATDHPDHYWTVVLWMFTRSPTKHRLKYKN